MKKSSILSSVLFVLTLAFSAQSLASFVCTAFCVYPDGSDQMVGTTSRPTASAAKAQLRKYCPRPNKLQEIQCFSKANPSQEHAALEADQILSLVSMDSNDDAANWCVRCSKTDLTHEFWISGQTQKEAVRRCREVQGYVPVFGSAKRCNQLNSDYQ